MKTFSYLFSLMVLPILILTTSCNKDDDVEIALGKIVAKIDGDSFESTGSVAHIEFTGFPAPLDTMQTFTLLGARAVGLTTTQSVSMVFVMAKDAVINKTTYSYDSDIVNCDPETEICGELIYTVLEALNPNGSQIYESETGSFSVTFTEVDYQLGGFVKGNFSGTLIDQNGNEASLTDGKFHLPIE